MIPLFKRHPVSFMHHTLITIASALAMASHAESYFSSFLTPGCKRKLVVSTTTLKCSCKGQNWLKVVLNRCYFFWSLSVYRTQKDKRQTSSFSAWQNKNKAEKNSKNRQTPYSQYIVLVDKFIRRHQTLLLVMSNVISVLALSAFIVTIPWS